MKAFLYSSPHKYYMENLVPLAKFLNQKNVEVFGSYKLSFESDKGSEFDMLTGQVVQYSNQLLSKKIKPDFVILVQCWWEKDKIIAEYCKKNKIRFYIVDHAPPMMRYTQKDGTPSHKYRDSGLKTSCYFSYGNATVKIMKEVGFNEKNIAIGSSRLESYLEKNKENKKGFVIFDTSNKMEDESLVKPLAAFIRENNDKQFILREHSRSPKFFRKILKYENVLLDKKTEECFIYEYSDFIFTFPSSAMLVPSLLNKNIYSLYDKHFCLEAKEYYEKYKYTIPSLGLSVKNNFENFIKDNIEYNKTLSTNERIYNYIKKDLK